MVQGNIIIFCWRHNERFRGFQVENLAQTLCMILEQSKMEYLLFKKLSSKQRCNEDKHIQYIVNRRPITMVQSLLSHSGIV